ncbi:MAG: Hsp20/alpha crystallin family protein [Pseudomonadota bacterium]
MANQLRHFDPFGDLARMEPLRSVEDFFRDFGLKHAMRDLQKDALIRLDVTESDQAYNVKAEIPGMKKEDIKVDVEGNHVSISAETKRESEEKQGETVVRSERYYGQQYRSFSLEHDIDDSQVVAKYQDGVLELTLPKRANNSAKKIVIN